MCCKCDSTTRNNQGDTDFDVDVDTGWDPPIIVPPVEI